MQIGTLDGAALIDAPLLFKLRNDGYHYISGSGTVKRSAGKRGHQQAVTQAGIGDCGKCWAGASDSGESRALSVRRLYRMDQDGAYGRSANSASIIAIRLTLNDINQHLFSSGNYLPSIFGTARFNCLAFN